LWRAFPVGPIEQACATQQEISFVRKGLNKITKRYHIVCRGNYAFITTLRSPEYLVFVRELHCSLMKTNPGARLIVIGVEGDLDENVVKQVKEFSEYREVEDLNIPNFK
jgi:hypothetical protein